MPTGAEVSPYILYPIVAAFFLGLFAFAFWWSQREQRARDRFCQRFGLDYDEAGGPLAIPPEFHVLRAGPMGTEAELVHGMTVEVGPGFEGVAILRYMHYGGPSPQAKGYALHIAWLTHPDLRAPHFRIAPRRWWRRLADLASWPDPALDPGFARRFHLAQGEKDAVITFLSPAMQQALARLGPVGLEARDAFLIIYQPTRMWQLQRFRPRTAARLLKFMRECRARHLADD